MAGISIGSAYSVGGGLSADIGLSRGDGFYTPWFLPSPALNLVFAGATSLDSRITFSRPSLATMYDSTGKLTYAPNNLVITAAGSVDPEKLCALVEGAFAGRPAGREQGPTRPPFQVINERFLTIMPGKQSFTDYTDTRKAAASGIGEREFQDTYPTLGGAKWPKTKTRLYISKVCGALRSLWKPTGPLSKNPEWT